MSSIPYYRTSSLDELGDLTAEPGSRDWAIAVVRKIDHESKAVDNEVRSLKEWVKLAREKGADKAMGYMSFEALLMDACNLGEQAISAILDADDNATVKAVLRAGVGRPKKGESVNGSDTTINGRRDNTYLIARIERDFPDVDVADYPSVRQAAIACGIIKEKTNLEKAIAAYKKLNKRERSQFMTTITYEAEGDDHGVL